MVRCFCFVFVVSAARRANIHIHICLNKDVRPEEEEQFDAEDQPPRGGGVQARGGQMERQSCWSGELR